MFPRPTRAWLAAGAALLVLPCLVLGRPAGAVPATLVVRLPADARLLVDGEPTRQTGPERTFVTPPLEAGKRYRYQLTAVWAERGEQKRVERTARFSAGQRVVVDFAAPAEGPAAGRPKSRTFEFTYAATVTGLDPAKAAKVWVPVPQELEEQQVKTLSLEVKGDRAAEVRLTTEPRYNNRMAFAEVRPSEDGKVTLRFVWRVTRHEVRGETGRKLADDMKLMARLLQADALVPIDGKPLELLKGRRLPDDPFGQARVLYDVVNDHLKYGKAGDGWGRGDSVWACDSKYGNCSDFHSLFISLARSRKIPAKFEIGFPLPEARGRGAVGGYHCWAYFKPDGKSWVPVDISEANKNPRLKDYYFGNLTEDRVAFSTGRDLILAPKQEGKPLNFFVYPHVEVDGKEHPQAKVEKSFAYKDVR